MNISAQFNANRANHYADRKEIEAMSERRSAEEILAEEGLPSEGGQTDESTPDETTRDPVEEAGNESFPASDSPAWGGNDDPIPATPKPERS